MKGSIDRVFHSTMTKKKEQEMTERLRANPMDEEANKYFGEKIRKENVEAQLSLFFSVFFKCFYFIETFCLMMLLGLCFDVCLWNFIFSAAHFPPSQMCI